MVYLSIFDIIGQTIENATSLLSDFLSLVFESQMFVLKVFQYLPGYFTAALAPFFIVFIVLFILNRG